MSRRQSLTVAGSALLLAARCSPDTNFDSTAATELLPDRLRYTQLGPDSDVVSPQQAWKELVEAGRVTGTFDDWHLTETFEEGAENGRRP
ncbi:hypothetical protein G9U53_30350 [Rhodococcus sp. D-46]|uniref:hypothetical protein n=1 Tax=Rhodococcus sp. D-46 TaxID=2716265 RepID=UPI0013F6299A|nr:hypothetical protein [Rhodococcus sp. D-46]